MSGEPDQWRPARRLGGTIAADGEPLTPTARRRIHAWRDQWRVLACPPLPLVIDPDGDLHHGAAALALLADLSRAAGAPVPRLFVRAQAYPAAQHDQGGFAPAVVLAQHGSGTQGDQRVAQRLFVPAIDGGGAAAGRGVRGLSQVLACQGVQGKLVHG